MKLASALLVALGSRTTHDHEQLKEVPSHGGQQIPSANDRIPRAKRSCWIALLGMAGDSAMKLGKAERAWN
jgi:hypothetical protein